MSFSIVGGPSRRIPNCCKMFFPMIEKVGSTTITDVVGGVVLTPNAGTMAWRQPGGIVIKHTLNPGDTEPRVPTFGTLPNPGTKSFILFTVFECDAPTGGGGRFGTRFTIGDGSQASGKPMYGHADGDAGQVFADMAGGTATYVVGMDTFIGPTVGAYSSIGIVRDGSAFGTWQHSSVTYSDYNYPARNDFDVIGDIFTDYNLDPANNGPKYGIRGAGDLISTEVKDRTGIVARNDYGVNISNVTSDGTNDLLPGFGYVTSGMPGIWGYIDPAYPMPAINKIAIGWTLEHPTTYGIAMFIFDNGLPADFKDALRWMRDQWKNGTKVIWPGWKDL